MTDLAQRDVSPADRDLIRPSRGRALKPILLGALGLLGLLVLWFIGTDLLPGPGSFIRRFSPFLTVASLGDLVTGSDLLTHVAVSLKRVLVGLAFAVVIGVPLGLAVGSSRPLDTATSPAFQLLRMISPLSWMPIAVMLFGLGDGAIYFLLSFAATWPILLNTAAGVRALDQRWLLLGRSLAATRTETLLRIVIPGVMGHVLTGIRLAIGISWIVLVPCEMLGVSAGLGYLILDTRDRLAYSELMAVVLVIGVIGFALDGAARALHAIWRR
ncbi:ABC transporter permease [Beijerinckia sp. L45]|uniref:ABC transporter permease n=1 Tax=Beijerinckia sp. L45 TaxID=1641855 RepID=UPI00131C27D1|nr:ABC transporter permease [Beijerinckia sp. L45]